MKKKVLQISKYYYPYFGGTEQVARDIAKAINAYDDVEQKVICFNSDAKDHGYENHRKETIHEFVDGVEVIRCGYFAKVASQSISFSYAKEFNKVIKEFDPDIIILHYPNPFVSYFLLNVKKAHFKLVIYWHLDITKQKLLGKLFHSQNKALINRASKIAGATPIHLNESKYTKSFGNKKYILPYTIDEKRLVITDEEKSNALAIRKKYQGKVLCFFIGRHVPYKGLDYLIESSAKINQDNIQFLIAGNGELTEKLKAKSVTDSKITFLGRVTDSEWRTYLYASDIFCFPSITRNEGFGLAQAEAMFYKKPVVTFHIEGSGVNYVNIDGLTGIECPNRDVSAYSRALVKLANDSNLRKLYGENGYKRVLENFTEEIFRINIKKMIDTLCSSK